MNGSALGLVPSADLLGLSRELLLVGGGVLILLLDAFVPWSRRFAVPLALLTVLSSAAPAMGVRTTHPELRSAADPGRRDDTPEPRHPHCDIPLPAGLWRLSAPREARRRPSTAPCLLWCAAGTLLMLRATELLTVFVALELFSICLYTLAGYHRRNTMATESAIKYFLMGAFVSSFILYGIALIYGETGATKIDEIALALHFAGGLTPAAMLGLLLLVAGFGFKLSLVPFHAWAPDAYQGAPSPFVAFFSVAPKVASMVVLIRVLEIGLYIEDGGNWQSLMALLASASMLFGTFVALVQRDFKRMLAYSGIAHMGYLLIPLASWSGDAWAAVIVYLLAYALMNAGAFALLSALYDKTDEPHLIDDLAGWGYRYPGISIALTICMLSLGGIPPTLGFEAKYLVFVEAIDPATCGWRCSEPSPAWSASSTTCGSSTSCT